MATKSPAQAFSTRPRPNIVLNAIVDQQIKAIGFDPDTQTAAVTFQHGAGPIYHYSGISQDTFAQFAVAENKGKFFAAHIKPQPFEKFPAETIEHQSV